MRTPRVEKLPTLSRLNYKISRFNNIDGREIGGEIPLNICSYGYNIKFRSGMLCGGMGIDRPVVTLEDGSQREIPNLSKFARAMHRIALYRRKDPVTGARDDRLLAFSDVENNVYETEVVRGDYTVNEAIKIEGYDAECINYYTGGKDCLLIFLPYGGMYLYDGDTAVLHETPPLTSVCMHYDRVYGVGADGTSLHFSAPLEPHNFAPESGGGTIRFMDEGGKVEKVVSFKDYLFIFREHAVHRMRAYTDPSEYTVTKIFESDTVIHANTVAITDDVMMFVIGTHLMIFDGYTVRRYAEGLSALIDTVDHGSAVFFENKYYLGCRIKTRGEIVGDEKIPSVDINNALLEVDPYSDDVAVLRGTDVRRMTPVVLGKLSFLLILFNNYRQAYCARLSDSGRIMGNVLEKLWISPTSDLGERGRVKSLKRVYITAEGPLTLGIGQGGELQTRTVYASPSEQVLPFRTRGNDLYIRIETEGDGFRVYGMTLVLDLIRRYYAN